MRRDILGVIFCSVQGNNYFCQEMSDTPSTSLHTLQGIEKMEKALRSNGYNVTHERRVIMTYLCGRAGKVVSVRQAAAELAQQQSGITEPTVYNTIRLFETLGLLMTCEDAKGRKAFTVSEDTRDRIFLVCENCGSVRVKANEEVDRFLRRSSFGAFSSQWYSLRIMGLCAGCRRKLSRAGKRNSSKK